MFKLCPLGSKKQNTKFWKDKNIMFLLLGSKIKIRYIFMDEKLI